MASSSSSQPKNKKTTNKRGVDALLTATAKALPVGENTCRFRLVKGPVSHSSADPVDAKAPPQPFPAIAKFPVSVVRPNFTNSPWKDGRLYQQDIPKPAEDSDEEDGGGAGGAADTAANGGEAAAGADANAPPKPKKKRWKYNRPQVVQRQWILQEQVDFLETMVARREGTTTSTAASGDNHPSQQLSSRYEGVPEHNASHYALVMVVNNTSNQQQASPCLQIRTVPAPLATIPFAQPAARTSLSLSQAEQAISDQRSGIRSTLLVRSDHNAVVNGNTTTAAPPNKPPPVLRLPRRKAPNTSKNRLLEKFKKQTADIEEAEDVMGDVGFKSRSSGSGGGGAARRDLLASLGDGLAVSQEGVLGGTNDAAFGGRGDRFGQLSAAAVAAADNNNNNNRQSGGDDEDDGGGGGGAARGAAAAEKSERGADGAAMEEDFYQRDVKAEYEELDYDANEQFDDDDVDLGESEVVVDTGGFGDEDEDDELEELDEEEEEDIRGAEGLATAAGFKAMLAKARGEVPPDAADNANAPGGAAAAAATANDAKKRALDSANKEAPKKEQEDHMAKIMRATAAAGGASASSAAASQNNDAAAAAASAASTTSAADLTNQVDEHGLRIISQESVRREIWLNHGSIPLKRLLNTFGINKKKSPERWSKFMTVVKELCTMEKDTVGVRILKLKQHYAK